MTYKDLAELIAGWPPTLKDSNVTIFVPGVDEYFPATVSYADESQSVLDSGHPVITPV